MSNNQALTTIDRDRLFESIRKQDVNAIREIVYHDSKDVIDAINYWKAKRHEPDVFKDKQQRDLIGLEIIRLEAFMLGRTEYSFSFFKIAEDDVIQQNAEIISKDWFKTIEPGADQVVDLLESIADKSTTKDLFPKTIKLSDLRERCIKHLTDGEGEKAVELATRYLSAGNYTPDKKINKKVEKYHKGRIDTWLNDLIRTITKDKAVQETMMASIKAAIGGNTTSLENEKTKEDPMVKKAREAAEAAIKANNKKPNPTQPANKSQEQKPGAGQETVENANSTKGAVDNVKPKIEEPEAVGETELEPRAGVVEISILDKDKLMAWLKATDQTIDNWLDEDTTEEILFEKYESITVTVDDVDSLLEELTTVYGLEASEVVDETMDAVEFENESMTLTEEITHIDNFLKQALKLRGVDPKKSEHVEEIKELCEAFFESREDGDYEEQSKVSDLIINHPENLKDAKTFFSQISYPKPTVFTAKDSENKNTVDNYNAVIAEIEADVKAIKGNKEEKRLMAQLEDKWVNQLRGQILSSKEEREDKTSYIASRVTFYTKYHIYNFIDKIRKGELTSKKQEKKITPDTGSGDKPKTESEKKQNATSSSKVENKTDVSTTPKLGASDKQTKKDDSKNVSEEPVTKGHTCATIEEALALVVKNGGKEEDAYIHPFCEALKGTPIKDPSGVFTIVLDDVNYKNYINRKYDEALELYKSTLTEYPMEDMAKLITLAVEAKQTAEDFVEENISLIEKADGTFLKITGKIGDADSTAVITSKETFLSWVKEMYELEEKIGIIDEPKKVYEISATIKSFKDFENQVKDKVTKDKVTLEDLKKWAREEAVDKVLGTDNQGVPFWFSDKERAGYMDSYLEMLTKPLYETPEGKLKQENALKDYIIVKLKTSEQTLYPFQSEIKKYCVEKKYDYSLKELTGIILSLAETHNKTMFDAYKKISKDNKASDSEPKTFDSKPAENKDQKATIIENPDSVEDTNKIVAEIYKETRSVTTKIALRDVFLKYKAHPVAVMRAAVHLIQAQKQIKDLKLITVGEINSWVTEIITGKKPEPEAIKDDKAKNDSPSEKKETSTPANTDGKDLFAVLGASPDKRSFRANMDAVINANEDSSEFRKKFITAITGGSGLHVKIVAKQPLEDMNKMIKSAFERKQDKAPKEKV